MLQRWDATGSTEMVFALLRSSTVALAEQLAAGLPDEFSRTVLAGSLGVAWDSANPIRANLFAAGIREAVTYVLHFLAPDEAIKACGWYKTYREKQKKIGERTKIEFKDQPTRVHRMVYATQGGIPDKALEELGVDIGDAHKKLRFVVDELSKYTHVRPGTLIQGDDKVVVFMEDTLGAMIRFLTVVSDVRAAIVDAVSEHANCLAGDALTESVVQELDELSTHTMVEEVIADDIQIVEIGPDQVQLEVRGKVYVELNYGSGADFRRGDGASMRDKYPFSVKMIAAVTDLKPVIAGPVRVDNSSFFE
ncbi:hypothetical protein M2360_000780 [Rhizobium sp. SG_E_25_P2]|uniref:pPIWI-associating nuclease domain-containing protein n=1 Tax=Rhizobium sp. SG_E_25_P2 TaxID=2879942 RepID=UPI0024769997|nr:hypothetical protein [Rhizobium sp. SG_E_25_P2]MDH6265399.1 hypothetical protein [Rhizobium sp. SG_E_25_P2]